MNDYSISNIDYWMLGLIIILTLLIVYLFIKKLNSAHGKLAISFITFSVLFYSGAGIASIEVDNKYLYYYLIYLIFLFLPACLIYKSGNKNEDWFDTYLFRRQNKVKYLAYFYILFLLIPCIVPEFKLGNILNIFSSGNLVDMFDRQKANGGIFNVICDNISMILSPAYFIYIGMLVSAKKKGQAILLVILDLLLHFCQLSYLGRYRLMIYGAFIIFILFPPLLNGKINKKSIIILGCFVILMLPLLYLFVYFRLGNEAEELSILEMVESLLLSESYYPIFYDRILSHEVDTSLFNMILWIALLPIPSIILPNKPSIDTTSFTYMITGLQKGDSGFAIMLPSVLGESFAIGGQYLFFVHAIIVGCVYMWFLNFTSKYKSLNYLFLYYVLYSLVLGRGGAGSFLPTLINYNISLFILYYIAKKKYQIR